MIYLTENGKILFEAIKLDALELSDQYKKILKTASYEKMIGSPS